MSLILNSGMTLGPGLVLDANPYIPPPPPPVPTIVTDGLVLHYDFSDPACYSSGVTVNDLSTANNEGSVANAYGHISYVSSGTNSYFNWDSNSGGGGDPNSFGSSIFTESTGVYRDFTIILQPDFTMSGMGGVICVPGDKSLRVYNNVWAFPNAGNDDDWAAGSFGTTTFYVNGQASNQLLTGWNIIGGATTNPAFFTPNQLYIGTSGYGGRHMQGKIALVLMYNRALTEQEQLQNYTVLRARFGL
jgi:hypothetical protein